MKILLIIGIVVVSIFTAVQIGSLYVSKKTEQQPYSLVRKQQKFEIRYYPEAIMATVVSDGNAYRQDANNNFRRLANFIFGGNTEARQIAMTAPVHMESSDKGSVMSFVMPADMSLESLPKPKDASVSLHKAPAGYFAALRFGGFAPEEVIREKIDELQALLQQEGLRTLGGFRYLGYNAPFEVVGRRNEILVEIAYDEAAGLEP